MNTFARAIALAIALGVAPAHVGFGADALRPRASFDPRFEKDGGTFAAAVAAPGGGFYVAGRFSSIDGQARTGIARFLANGSLDPAFVPIDFDDGEVRALALQADGRLILGGKFRRVGATPRGGMARLHPDGSLDLDFATGTGLEATAAIHAIAVQSDGRILIGGTFFGFDRFASRGVARLLANGAVDTTFVAADLSPFEINAIVVRSDGRIYVGGSFQVPTVFQRPGVARLLANGALDPSFGTGDGFTPTHPYNAVHALLPDANNAIIVGGGFSAYDGTARGGLVRLNDDGSLDAAFNPGAGFSGDLGMEAPFSGVTALARQGDGAILATGVFTHFDGTPRSQIARLTAAGALDTTFDPQGAGGPAQFTGGNLRTVAVLSNGSIVSAGTFRRGIGDHPQRVFRFSATGAVDAAVNPAIRSPAVVHALVRDSQGRFIAAGDFTHVDGQARGRIARILADGSLDPGYAAAGEGFNGIVRTLALAGGDGVYVGGEFDHWDATKSGRIARLTAAGALDAAFAVGDGFSGVVRAIALQSDGRVIVGGDFDYYGLSAPRKRLARLEATGALDSGFLPGDVFLGAVHTLLPQADGRIVVGGNFQTWPGVPNRASLARVHADGSFDATFGGGTGGFFASGPSNPVGTIKHLLPGSGGTLYAAGDFSAYHGAAAVVATHHVARLTADGAIDATFAFPAANGSVFAALAQADGQILLGGNLTMVADKLQHGLARVMATGTLDATLGAPAYLDTPYAPAEPNDTYLALALSSDNLLVAGGNWLRYAGFAGQGLVLFEPAPGPQIVTPPQEQVAHPGDDVTFAVTATGTNLSYQWFHDGTPIAGATGASLTLTDVEWTDAGAYTVEVRDNDAAAVTDPVSLRGPNPVPVITAHPGIADVTAGESATLTVAATGTGPLAYHWRFNGGTVAGATGATLTRPGAAMTDAGWYDVVVADGLSIATSQAGRVFVRPMRYGNAYRADPTFAPRLEIDGGIVTVVAAAPDGTFYVGGQFSSLDEHPRAHIARFLASGAMDPGFTPSDFGRLGVNEILPAAGGKVYVAGPFGWVGGSARPRLVRLNHDGTVDESFDAGSDFTGHVEALAEDGEGRLLVGGLFTTVGGLPRRNLVRLRADGSVDPTFVIGSGFDGDVTALALDSSGRILVGGLFNNYNGSARAKVVRLQADGSLDGTFAIGSNDISRLHVLAPQADGRVLIGGWFTEIAGTARRFIARVHGDGSLDAGFDAGENFATDVRSIDALGDGRLLVTGHYYSGTAYIGPVVRLTSTGARDGAFVPPAPLASIVGRDGARLADGRVVLVLQGTLATNPPPYQSVVLLGVDGARDETFAPATRMPTAPAAAIPAAGGGWIVAGGFSYVDGAPAGSIARLHADGSRDTTFASGSGFNGPVSALATADSGAFYAAGSFASYDGAAAPGLVRIRTDGTRDAGFQPTAVTGRIDTLAVLPNGRIWIGGDFEPQADRPGAIARLARDGAFDRSFAAGVGLRHTYITGYPAPGFSTTTGSVWAVLPGAAGSVLVGGAFSSQAGVSRPGIARFLEDGELDLTFDPGAGFRGVSGFDTVSGSVLALDTLPDGRILAGGSFHAYDNATAGNLVRLAATGARDTSFDTVTTPNHTLLAQSDGKVIVAGTGDPQHTVLARLLANGDFDPAFVVRDAPTDYTSVRPLAWRADGALLASGDSVQLGSFTARGVFLLRPDDPPVIGTPPQPQTTTAGGATTLTVVASGSGPISHQWQKLISGHGTLGATPLADTWVDIAGATGASYMIPSTQAFHAGTYRVVLTAGGASTASEPVTVTVTPPESSSARLLNLSARALCLTGDDVLIPGFFIQGTGTKQLLMRAVGPELTAFGVPGAMADPRMVLKRQSDDSVVATNDDWGQNTNWQDIRDASVTLYAFALQEGSKSAALLLDLPAGGYTIVASGHGDETGVSIVELYDVSGAMDAARLINISNRGFVGVGGQIMIPGFVVSAEGSRTFLIRAVGPTLSRFNVPGVLADPHIEVYKRRPGTAIDDLILTNDTWGENGDAAQVRQTATAVSAFGLTEGSLDAAFVVTLPPGAYTVNAKGVGDTTGVALVEVYLVP